MDKLLYLFVIVFCVTKTSSLYTNEESNIRSVMPAGENQFRYVVSVQRLSGIYDANRGHSCGGVLLSLQHAVTAASCVVENNNGVMSPINRDAYRVFAGSIFLSNDTSADRVRRIASTAAHPEYNPMNHKDLNNIGVIILGVPFSPNTVAPLSIGDIGTDAVEMCTTMGWTTETQLMYGRMLTLNDTLCQRYLPPQLPNGMCGIPEGIRAGCPGDVGGPLVCNIGLVGILTNPNTCTITNPMYQIFTRASRYSAWVDSVIALPIPPLGPEPPTVPPPTTPAPGAASTFQPGVILLAVIAVTHILSAKVIS